MDEKTCCELNSDEKGLYLKCPVVKTYEENYCKKEKSSSRFGLFIYVLAQVVAGIVGWEIGKIIFKAGF